MSYYREDKYIDRMDKSIDSFWYEDGRFKIGKAIGAFFIGLMLCLGLMYVSTVFGWFAKPAQIYSVENVEKEYEWFYNQRRGMEAVKANIESTDSRIDALFVAHGQDTSKWPSVPKQEYLQLVDARSISERAYNEQCSEYQARHDNVFHNLVAPGDIPRSCPLIQNSR